MNRYLVRIEVPDDVYDARRVINPPPVGWDAEPYGLLSVGLGDDWAASNGAALLDVPPSSFQTKGMYASIRSMRTRRVGRWGRNRAVTGDRN